MRNLRMVDQTYQAPKWQSRFNLARAITPWLIALGAVFYSCLKDL